MPRKPTATDCLQAKNPAVAALWHPTWNADKTPQDFLAGSGFRAWWLCSNGHSWQATINSRTTRGGSGCPYCSGNRPWPGESDLASVAPDIAAEWDVERNGSLRPTEVTAKSSKRAWWTCRTCGHHWRAVIATRHEHGCPACAGVIATPERNLLLSNPELAAEADGWDPASVAPSSGRKMAWRCSEGHQWRAVVANRSNGSGCPNCYLASVRTSAS